MRIRIWHILTLALVLGIAYMLIFELDTVKKWFRAGQKAAEGYGAAETPKEAIEYLNKALEKRKYEFAKDYLAGDFASELGKVAEEAQELAKAIDSIRAAMEERKIQGEGSIDPVLAFYDRFPKRLELVGEIKQDGDNRAVAVVAQDFAIGGKRSSATVPLTREGGEWRILLPLTPENRQWFAVLKKKGPAYTQAIMKIDGAIKGRDMTKQDVLKELNDELTIANRTN